MIEQSGPLRACYDRGPMTAPSLHGRIVVRLTIQPDGKVVHAAVLTVDAGLAEVATCVAGTLATLRFPTAIGTTTINYPLVFPDVVVGPRAPRGPPRIQRDPVGLDTLAR